MNLHFIQNFLQSSYVLTIPETNITRTSTKHPASFPWLKDYLYKHYLTRSQYNMKDIKLGCFNNNFIRVKQLISTEQTRDCCLNILDTRHFRRFPTVRKSVCFQPCYSEVSSRNRKGNSTFIHVSLQPVHKLILTSRCSFKHYCSFLQYEQNCI